MDVEEHETPGPRLTLPELATYFGVPKLSSITGGLDAVERYWAYQTTQPGPDRDAARDELLLYNRDDLDALIGVAAAMRDLTAKPTPAPRSRRARRPAA